MAEYVGLDGHHDVANPPVQRLPPEILSEVFLYCFVGHRVVVPPNADKLPWTLSVVCSTWREVVVKTPALWNNVYVSYASSDLESSSNPYHVSFTRMLQEVLARSHHLPLSLDIEQDDNYDPPEDPLTFLLPHLDHLKDLTIIGLGDAFFSLSIVTFPVLETIYIQGGFESERSISVCGAPNLREIRFCFDLETCDWLQSVPLSQLTVLNLPSSSVQLDVLLSLLAHCVSLVECDVGLRGPLGTPPPPRLLPSTVTLPALTKLTLRPYAHVGITCIDRVILPNLTHFVLIGFWLSPLLHLITHSGCLETLTVQRPYHIPSLDLEILLAKTPNLSSLSLRTGGMLTASTLQGMSSGKVVPKLSRLQCLLDSRVLGVGDALNFHTKMLRNRTLETNTATHIADVSFHARSARECEIIRHLETLVEGGWNIEVATW